MSSKLAVFAISVGLAACTVGSVPPANGDDVASPDAPPVGPGDANPNGCIAAVPGGGGDGHHNPGLGCVTAACHGVPLGADAPQFSIGGTLYTDALGSGPGIDGASILVTDANGVSVTLVTRGLNGPGNFYSENLALVPPFTVKATQCPSLMQMGDPATDGNCNSCHTPGGTANARIHL